jgi:subtilisin family serine protease
MIFESALEYVGKNAKKGKSVINLSISGPKSKMVNDALTSTTKDYNIPIFVSAGNTADDSCNYSPSDNPDVFTVGATTRDDNVAVFSATGKCVQLYAPGQDIQSAWIGSQDNSMIMDGTSMANPHVVGIAALLMAQKSYDSSNDLYNALTEFATKDELEFYETSGMDSHNLLAHVV